jgi:Tol biopolymer transport system component
MSSIQALTPPALERVVRKCLSKDPEERWQNAADLGSELKWIGEAGSQAGVPATVATKRRSRERVAWIGFGLAVVAAAALALAAVRPGPPAPRLIRSSLLMPDKVTVAMLALSPDGGQLAFTAADVQGRSSLWIRALDGSAPRPVPGTDGAQFPFWSPNARSIGFFADKKLKRIEVAGGSPITVCDAPDGGGASWSAAGVVLIGQASGPVLRVSASGGTPAPVTRLEASTHETTHRYPVFLPDGRHFLYLALNLNGTPNSEDNNVCVGSLDGKDSRRIVHGYSSPAFAAGQLLVVRDAHLVAQAFDTRNLRVTGEPVTIAENVGLFGGYVSLAQLTASDGGVLVHAGTDYVPRQLQWVDRQGRRLSVVGEPGLYAGPMISPDGQKALLTVFEPGLGKSQILLVDLARGVKTRLTNGPSENWGGVFSPDGSRVVFSTDRAHQADIYEKSSGGSMAETAVLEGEGQRLASDWSSDGRYILYFDREPRGLRRIGLMALPMFGDRKPIVVLERTQREDLSARFSRDGRWIAYSADDSGRPEVYVIPFPPGPDSWQVSTSGGSKPVWRRDGKELYYVAADGKLMAVDVAPGPRFTAGPPRVLFDTGSSIFGPAIVDVASDGQRFLVTLPADASTPPLNLVVNWTSAVRR